MVFVLCNHLGIAWINVLQIVDCFVQFAENRDKEIEKYNVGETCVLKHRQSDSIILGACDGNASLPVNPVSAYLWVLVHKKD